MQTHYAPGTVDATLATWQAMLPVVDTAGAAMALAPMLCAVAAYFMARWL